MENTLTVIAIIALYCTGHWIGATVLLALAVIGAYMS